MMVGMKHIYIYIVKIRAIEHTRNHASSQSIITDRLAGRQNTVGNIDRLADMLIDKWTKTWIFIK